MGISNRLQCVLHFSTLHNYTELVECLMNFWQVMSPSQSRQCPGLCSIALAKWSVGLFACISFSHTRKGDLALLNSHNLSTDFFSVIAGNHQAIQMICKNPLRFSNGICVQILHTYRGQGFAISLRCLKIQTAEVTLVSKLNRIFKQKNWADKLLIYVNFEAICSASDKNFTIIITGSFKNNTEISCHLSSKELAVLRMCRHWTFSRGINHVTSPVEFRCKTNSTTIHNK